MTAEQLALVRHAVASGAIPYGPLNEAVGAVIEENIRLRAFVDKVAWDRTPGYPPVPVLQPRYDALKADRDRMLDLMRRFVNDDMSGWPRLYDEMVSVVEEADGLLPSLPADAVSNIEAEVTQ